MGGNSEEGVGEARHCSGARNAMIRKEKRYWLHPSRGTWSPQASPACSSNAQLSSKCLAAALFPTPSRLQVYGECEHPLLPYFLIPKPGASLILKPFISLVIVTRSCGCLSHPFSHTKPELTHFFFSPAMCFWLRSGLHQLSLNCSTCP